MTPNLHETFSLETGGPGSGMLMPGRIQRALALGCGIRAEELGALVPTGRGRVAVEIAVHRATTLATPRYVPFTEAGRPGLLVLRRDSDPPTEGRTHLQLSWSGDETPPTPGAVATALATATGGALGAEELGWAFAGPGWLRLDVPERVLLMLQFPARLDAQGRELTLDLPDDGKKKALNPPARRLAEAAASTRADLDAGRTERIQGARALARLARGLLRRHPTDAELASAVSHLAVRRFEPPHPLVLPEGMPQAVWTQLSARDAAGLSELEATLVALPDPVEEPERTAQVIELLLLAPGAEARAARLIERAAPTAAPRDLALWQFRQAARPLLAAERTDPADWEAALAPLRDGGLHHGPALATALRIAASSSLTQAHAYGADWCVPVLGGRRIVNMELALERRPALAQELSRLVEWLEEAARVEGQPEADEIEALVAEAEAEDVGGDAARGTALLLDASARSGERADLVAALAARAELLQDPALAAHVAGLGGALDAQEVRRVASRPIELAELAAPEPPTGGWSRRVLGPGDAGPEPGADGVEQLAFLEAAGAARRAAIGWLERGDESSLLQAVRLREALPAEARARLVQALTGATPDDEQVLVGDPSGLALGCALHVLLPAGIPRQNLGLRLRAALPDVATPTVDDDAQPEVADDPHGATNRLSAAAELLDSGRADAASTIVCALLRKLDEPHALPQLLTLTLRLLSQEAPPEGIVATAERALLLRDATGDGLLNALGDDPLAAYALHIALNRAGLDRRRPDLIRVRLLEAWLGIWRATETPPEPSSIQELMHVDHALLPLAAARLAGVDDPVARAREFLETYPPLETAAAAYAAALLSLTLEGA